jgi:hypothetical protein
MIFSKGFFHHSLHWGPFTAMDRCWYHVPVFAVLLVDVLSLFVEKSWSLLSSFNSMSSSLESTC